MVDLDLRRPIGRLNTCSRRSPESAAGLARSDDVVNAIAARCTEVETGARDIHAIVNRTILPEPATGLLGDMGEDGRTCTAASIGLAEGGRFTCTLS